MRFSAPLMAVLSLAPSALAFAPRAAWSRPTTSLAMSSSSSADEKVAALQAAAAKAREEVERLNKELGKTSTAAAPTLPKKSADEVQALVPTLLAETDLEKQLASWSDLKESQSVSAFGSANLRTFAVDLKMLEQRTGLTSVTLGLDAEEVNLDDFKYATLYVLGFSSIGGVVSLAALPPNVGATLCYVFAILPILFLGIGSTSPGIIAGAIASLRSDDNKDGVSTQERRTRHEAAHFCCGYWCGLAVRDYSVESGLARVEFDVAATQEYAATEVAALAITALAGLVGEALAYRKAIGASEDLLALENVFTRSADFMGSAARQDVTRWGALTAFQLLKQHQAKYEKVVEAFSRSAPLEECIGILEA